MASTLPSPPVSASSLSSHLEGALTTTNELPTPRRRPLHPGSQKEIALINYMDGKLLRMQRRYGKKFSNSEQDCDDTPGYTCFEEIVRDVDPLIDLVWTSSTPALQIPYLLSLAGVLVSYLPAFPFSVSTFLVLRKLDQGFATLLRTNPPPTSTAAETSVVSRTEKVRIKSLAEDTRVAVVNIASRAGHAAVSQEYSSDDDDEEEDEDDGELSGDEADHDGIDLSLGRVYKKTLELLGDQLT